MKHILMASVTKQNLFKGLLLGLDLTEAVNESLDYIASGCMCTNAPPSVQ